MGQPVFKETQQRDVVYTDKMMTSNEAIQKGNTRLLPSIKSDKKSAVIVEFSTTQKVVQIIDNDNDKTTFSSPIESTSYRIEPSERRIEFSVQKKTNET